MYLYVLIRAKLCLECTYMTKNWPRPTQKVPSDLVLLHIKIKHFLDIFSFSLNVQARERIAYQMVCQPNDIHDETTCLNYIKLRS